MHDKGRSDEHAVAFVSIEPRRRAMSDQHTYREAKSRGGPEHRDADIRIPFFHRGKMHAAHSLEDDVDRSATGRPDHIHYQDREREMIYECVSESFFKFGGECRLL